MFSRTVVVQLSPNPQADDDLFSSYTIFDAPLKADGDGSFWKITSDKLAEYEELHVGIIGNLFHCDTVVQDQTTYCWSHCDCDEVYKISKGKVTTQEQIPRWSNGECRFFNFQKNKLTMFSTKTSEKFEMNVEIGREMYIYLALPYYEDDFKLTIEPVSEEIGVSIFR